MNNLVIIIIIIMIIIIIIIIIYSISIPPNLAGNSRRVLTHSLKQLHKERNLFTKICTYLQGDGWGKN